MREGRSRYNKIFEFNYTIQDQPCKMMFTSVTGHLMEMEFEGRYRKWHSCDHVDLFEAPIRKHVPEDGRCVKRPVDEFGSINVEELCFDFVGQMTSLYTSRCWRVIDTDESN
ncbi:putative DNA topoisomerase [Helianthus annuus]|nr:putative DNA topoisomerase [Helianthus annuus]